MRVGFIGVGNMGSEICRHLLTAGHEVTAYARGAQSGQRARDLGLHLAATPAALAAKCDILFTMVTTGKDVESVTLGPDGLIHGAHPGLVHVDMSTISPAITRNIAARLQASNVDMLDAPVSGGVAAARVGTLTFFIGGDADTLARVRPLLELLGKSIFHMGPSGTGQVTKLSNQICQLANIQGAAEALSFAQAQGADAGKVREAVMTGYGASRMLDVLGKKMVDRDFAAGIVAALHHKDIGVVMDMAHESGLPLPATAQVMQQLNALMGSGLGTQDTSSLLLVLEQMAVRKNQRRQP